MRMAKGVLLMTLGLLACRGKPIAVVVDLSLSTPHGCHRKYETFWRVIRRLRTQHPLATIDVYQVGLPKMTRQFVGRIEGLPQNMWLDFFVQPTPEAQEKLKEHLAALHPRTREMWHRMVQHPCRDCSGILATVYDLMEDYTRVVLLSDAMFEDYIHPENFARTQGTLWIIGTPPKYLGRWPKNLKAWRDWVDRWAREDPEILDPHVQASLRLEKVWKHLLGTRVRFDWDCKEFFQ